MYKEKISQSSLIIKVTLIQQMKKIFNRIEVVYAFCIETIVVPSSQQSFTKKLPTIFEWQTKEDIIHTEKIRQSV